MSARSMDTRILFLRAGSERYLIRLPLRERNQPKGNPRNYGAPRHQDNDGCLQRSNQGKEDVQLRKSRGKNKTILNLV